MAVHIGAIATHRQPLTSIGRWKGIMLRSDASMRRISGILTQLFVS